MRISASILNNPYGPTTFAISTQAIASRALERRVRSVLVAFGRGVASQFNVRMLLLALLPLCAAAAAWGVLLWLGLQPTIDMVQRYFAEHDGFAVSGRWLSMFGLAAFKTVIVPLIALWVFLPLMVATALICVGTMALPAIVRHVGSRVYPGLERRRGGSFLGTLWLTMTSLLLFVALWIATTPLCAFPAVGFAIQPLLWGWLTCRVMAYDVLSGYADVDEREALLRRHRWQLLSIGTVTGLFGVAPSLFWMGGTLSIVLFPFFAVLSICLYVLVFTFSGLWFTHYGLAALRDHRAATPPSQAPAGNV
jgi:hypothetical protein